MNSQEAKGILLLYRPGSLEASEGPLAEALEQTQRDPELRHWFEQHCVVQSALREKFRHIPAPTDLKESILAMNKVVSATWWHRPMWLATAAGFALLLGLSAVLLQPRANDRFGDYRSRMVRTALREYSMDIVTNDLKQIRQSIAQRGGPADYELPRGLEKFSPTGGGCLRWRGNPVSMVCFDRGDKQMFFLFVTSRLALKDAPSTSAQLAKINKLLTTSWSEGDKTYLLAGPEDSPLLRQQFH